MRKRKTNETQRRINQMYGRLRNQGALLRTRKTEDGTIEEHWALKEHRYMAVMDKGRMPHIFHSYSTDVTFDSQ
jgi:hypothetical protein